MTDQDVKISPQLKWNKAHPLERWAHAALRSALKKGLIEMEPCIECGNEKAEAHHADHRLPLHVQWLCRRCHKLEHKRLKGGNVNDGPSH